VNQRLSPVVQIDRLDPFCAGLFDDLFEHVDLHGFFEVEVFRVAHWARGAAQVTGADNIDVHIHCEGKLQSSKVMHLITARFQVADRVGFLTALLRKLAINAPLF
jgi:hypothetical protein